MRPDVANHQLNSNFSISREQKSKKEAHCVLTSKAQRAQRTNFPYQKIAQRGMAATKINFCHRGHGAAQPQPTKEEVWITNVTNRARRETNYTNADS
jgi:hypothetical protein